MVGWFKNSKLKKLKEIRTLWCVLWLLKVDNTMYDQPDAATGGDKKR